MDWKILAASFAALVIVSSVLLGGFGLGDFFSDIINTIGEFLGSSPFGGLGTTESGLFISITLFPSKFSTEIADGINITTDTLNIQKFTGTLHVDYENSVIAFEPQDTEVSINIPLQDISLDGLKLSKISVEDIDFEIGNEESGMTTGKGNIDIFDFSGEFMILIDRVEFNGNVSSISIKTGDSEWELK